MNISETLNGLLAQVRLKDDPYDVIFTKDDIALLTNHMMLVSLCIKLDLTREYPKDVHNMFSLVKETGDPAALLILAAMRNKVIKESLLEVCPQQIREVLC